LIYLNGTYNQTIAGNQSSLINFTLDVGTYNLTATLYYPNGTIYSNDTITFEVVGFLQLTCCLVEYIISYPSIVYENSTTYVDVYTEHAMGYNLSIYLNGTLNSRTWYDGNQSLSHVLPLAEAGDNITLQFEIHCINGSLVYNFTLNMTVEIPVWYYTPSYVFYLELTNDDILIDFWSNNTYKALLYIDGELEKNMTGNSSYYFKVYNLDDGQHVINIEVYNVLGSLFFTDVEYFNVDTSGGSTGGGGGGDDDDDDDIFGQLSIIELFLTRYWWLIIVLIGGIVLISFTAGGKEDRRKRGNRR